jgi:hypothetical protein
MYEKADRTIQQISLLCNKAMLGLMCQFRMNGFRRAALFHRDMATNFLCCVIGDASFAKTLHDGDACVLLRIAVQHAGWELKENSCGFFCATA